MEVDIYTFELFIKMLYNIDVDSIKMKLYSLRM